MSASKQEGGRRTTLQTLAHCHCSTARGQRQQRQQWERKRWRRKTVPSICSSAPDTDSLPPGPSCQVGSKTKKRRKQLSLSFTRPQVLDLNSCRTDNTLHTHTSLFLPSLTLPYTYSHPHSQHTSLLVAFWTSVFFVVAVFFSSPPSLTF